MIRCTSFKVRCFVVADDSDDDGYNGYGGYKEYGECDRGYYYRDGRYERKTSPMMSPIISPARYYHTDKTLFGGINEMINYLDAFQSFHILRS
ncbi:unnamed protein product [Rhizophagus irregularis]|nr:unnamed protein product [Rhizophagus irregularis]